MVLNKLRSRVAYRRAVAFAKHPKLVLDYFLDTLDSEGVALFQTLVYFHIGLASGLYGLLVAGGTPQPVEDAMGPVFNALWLWLCLAIMICLIGKMNKHDSGMWMQLTGDVAANAVLLIYIVASVQDSWWGEAVFAIWLALAIWECTALLIVRDIRRIMIDLAIIRKS